MANLQLGTAHGSLYDGTGRARPLTARQCDILCNKPDNLAAGAGGTPPWCPAYR